jgi:hypothetical protein
MASRDITFHFVFHGSYPVSRGTMAAITLRSSSLLQLVTDESFIPKAERDDDVYIMDMAIQSQRFTDKDLQIINYCRLYLHIATISEIFDADGHTIMDHIMKCQRVPWFDHVNVAIQQQPSG